MNLERLIEGVLFYKAEPMTKQELRSFFSVDENTLNDALAKLKENLTERGVVLTETDEEVGLATAPELSETIEAYKKENLKRDIGKAGAETLAIILYRGPVARADIDFIRGVNSTFVLRNLLMRGLIKREPHPTDKRQYQYAITTELLEHLGIADKKHLPDYEETLQALDTYEREQAASQSNEVPEETT